MDVLYSAHGENKMDNKKFMCSVKCPSVDEFAQNYPPYARFSKNQGEIFFNAIATPEAFVKMSVVSDLGFAAIYGIAEQCSCIAQKQGVSLDRYTKQFIGAVVCCVMENNGYLKTGRKKSINHPDFTKGEIYER